MKSHHKEMKERRMRNDKCRRRGDLRKTRTTNWKMCQSNIQVGRREYLRKEGRRYRKVTQAENWKRKIRSFWGPPDHNLEGLDERNGAKVLS